jgi:hypothetical protein
MYNLSSFVLLLTLAILAFGTGAMASSDEAVVIDS